MTSNRFISLLLISAGAFIAFYASYPSVLRALLELSSCRGTGGACGAMAVYIGVFVRLPIVLILCVFLFWAIAKRIDWLKISWGWSLVSGLWLFAAFRFLVAFGNFWAANFSLGFVYVQFPVTLLFLLVFVLFLILTDANPGNGSDPVRHWAWMGAKVSAGYALLLSISSIYSLLFSLPGLSSLASRELTVLVYKIANLAMLGDGGLFYVLNWTNLAAFVTVLIVVLLRQRRGGNVKPSTRQTPVSKPSVSMSRKPFGRRKYS